jgi:hypothetical protein
MYIVSWKKHKKTASILIIKLEPHNNSKNKKNPMMEAYAKSHSIKTVLWLMMDNSKITMILKINNLWIN